MGARRMTSQKVQKSFFIPCAPCILWSEEFLTTECTDLKKALLRGFRNFNGSGWREDA
jgi:hypothetical protein